MQDVLDLVNCLQSVPAGVSCVFKLCKVVSRVEDQISETTVSRTATRMRTLLKTRASFHDGSPADSLM